MEAAINKSNDPKRINPQKFGLWISMGSLFMMFVAFTSAYIVRQAAGNWLEFEVPKIFILSTAIIVLSSVILQGSYNSFIKEKESRYKGLLLLSALLGVGFLFVQVKGWNTLYSWGVDFGVNPSASFFYLINWVHAAHILAGLTTLMVAIIHAFTLKFNVTEFRKNRFLMVVQFWHFLGILWIIIYLFLLLTR